MNMATARQRNAFMDSGRDRHDAPRLNAGQEGRGVRFVRIRPVVPENLCQTPCQYGSVTKVGDGSADGLDQERPGSTTSQIRSKLDPQKQDRFCPAILSP